MTQKFGQDSELIVSKYLANQRFSILERNYKKFFGEIDIIAQKDDVIVFVEVKARKNSKVSLHNLVPYAKQQKIIKVARFFIADRHEATRNKILRFDVALLHVQDHQAPELTYIPNAFGLQNC
ncbi:YraN family protein [Candidatus Babeliales bacterium]|nr:YraN family protein [Candidatus Babeliales bacterium]